MSGAQSVSSATRATCIIFMPIQLPEEIGKYCKDIRLGIFYPKLWRYFDFSCGGTCSHRFFLFKQPVGCYKRGCGSGGRKLSFKVRKVALEHETTLKSSDGGRSSVDEPGLSKVAITSNGKASHCHLASSAIGVDQAHFLWF